MKFFLNNFAVKSVFWIAMMLLISCYQQKEGCLDIHATNFDASADVNCCCDYPRLQLNFIHKTNTKLYNSDDTLSNDLGQAYKINSFSIYMSGFSFKTANGKIISTTDTIRIPSKTDSIVLNKDIALVRPITNNILLGRLIQTDDFTEIDFNIGVPQAANQADISRIPESSNLSTQPDSMFTPNLGYISIRYTISDLAGNLKELRIYDVIPLQFNLLLTNKIAENTCLQLEIDHSYLMHDIDILNDSNILIENKIKQNFSKACTLKSCN